MNSEIPEAIRIAAYEDELHRQMLEAANRLDWRTASRIAALIGERDPIDHEASYEKAQQAPPI